MGSLPPALPFLIGALLLPLLPRPARPWAFLVPSALSLALLPSLEPGTSLSLPFLDFRLVPLRVDRLALVFGYVFGLIALLGGIYALHVRDTVQQVAALVYAGSSLGVVFAGDLFTLLVFWEGMALSSVWLIWARGTPAARGAGTRYLFVHLAGGALLTAGVLLHLGETGSLLFEPLEGGVGSSLILLAFVINAAVPPLHAWLADAYPEGTETGSVFLSAFTTKTAVYALARGFAGWEVLLWAGVAMAVYGVVYAVLENDIRRLLAYHIISQVGYMVAGVGLGTPLGINGATAHAFTHILYKGLLFMGTGAVLYATGRSRLTELGGLWRSLPVPLLLYMVGAFSISGVPLFSGFVSKPVTVYAMEADHRGLAVFLLDLASVGTFLHTGLKLPFFTWFGPDRRVPVLRPVPWNMTAGMALTALVNVFLGVYPAPLYGLLPYPMDYEPYTLPHVSNTLQLLVFTGLGFWLLLEKLGGEPTVTLDTDWFYRRPARLVYRVAVGWTGGLFGWVEKGVLRLVEATVRAAADPVGALLALLSNPRPSGDRPPQPYDPDRYRLPLGVMALVVVASFVALIAWFLVRPPVP